MAKAADIAGVFDNSEIKFLWSFYLCVASALDFLCCGVVALIIACRQDDAHSEDSESGQGHSTNYEQLMSDPADQA